MTPPRFKVGIYALEGLNAFASAYYFNYLLFLFRDAYQFGNLGNLAVGAGHGFLYIFASMYAGKFGQRRGYFTSLRVGFGGLALSMVGASMLPALWGQVLMLAVWTLVLCFTWPMLEALVSEHEAPSALPHRVGLYNVTWALCSSVAYFVGGTLYETLGPNSLYWLPGICYALKFFATFPLQRAHDAWLANDNAYSASRATVPGAAVDPTEAAIRQPYFLKLAWIANPFSYMAINTLTAVVPGIALNAGLGVAEAGRVMSVWFIVRALSFVGLWFWHGWHYRFRWFIGAFVLMLASFVTLMVVHEVWQLILAQVFFGWATGLIYYSSLYYSMDGSEAKGEHGGAHEALIGAGICAGPALSALSLWFIPSQPLGPVLAVGAFVLVGGVGLVTVRGRAQRTPPAGRA